jgi:transcriptional regulator with PAS, ATPase and Fis domain
MHIVGRTGKPEINHVQKIRGRNIVVQRIPIWKDGRIIAVFGLVMFHDAREVGRLAKRLSQLESKVRIYEQELLNLRSTRYTFDSIIGESPAVHELKEEALKATTNQFPVLITGESGTGKELFAQAIHHASERRIHPFIRINCAAIPSDLVESELFGYEKGAFTGARREGKPGKFEMAHRGTVFLDEIGDLPLEIQPKLLRALEEKEFERIGGTSVIQSDFRLIAATNQQLTQMMEEGRFRKDLYYRLNVIPLHLPALRQRKEDILPLARHMINRLADEANIARLRLEPASEQALTLYDWPGNVRELSNVIERTLGSLRGDTIRLEDLPFYIFPERKKPVESGTTPLRTARLHSEKEAICRALEKARFNKSRAAKILGIHRTHLYKKMKKHGIVTSAPTR